LDIEERGIMMRICIPTYGNDGLNNSICGHFGRAPTFTIYDTDTGEVKTIVNQSEHVGGTGTPPEHLSKENVNVMLCGGLGPKAIRMFRGYGIEVYVGATGTVQDTLTLWRNGQLQQASEDNACKDHAH